MKFKHVLLSAAVALSFVPAVQAKPFKWTSQGEISTWDIHSQNNALQSGLRCSGTEPFWGLSIDPKGHSGSLSSPEARTRMMQIDRVWPGQGAQPVAALSMQGMSAGGTAVLRPALCSYGMSDRSYAIAIDLFMADDRSNQTTTYSGCCSLAP